MPQLRFQPGDTVTWRSQAGQQRTGQVVAVIPPNDHPLNLGWHWHGEKAAKYRMVADLEAAPRRTESYLVEVPRQTQRGRPELHWPRVSGLAKAGALTQLF